MASVLIVGAGPAGTAAALGLAGRGHDVTVVDRAHFPRDKACGDGLTPAALSELAALGVDAEALGGHRVEGLRLVGGRTVRELPWPRRAGLPGWGLVVPRRRFDAHLVDECRRRGVEVIEGVVARPVPRTDRLEVELDGARLRPRYVVIADGASSRFGRAAGTRRDREFPLGSALRAYYRSARSADPFLECRLGVDDGGGRTVPGYGWVFPMGDGTVNVGVIALTTAGRWRGVKTPAILDRFVAAVAGDWRLDPRPLGRPRGGILPAGLGVTPLVGSNWLVAGDAAGAVDPFTGEGISAALASGRLAGAVVDAALRTDDPSELFRYPGMLEDRFGSRFRLGRAFAAALGRRWFTAVGFRLVPRAGPVTRWLFETSLVPPAEPGGPSGLVSRWADRRYR